MTPQSTRLLRRVALVALAVLGLTSLGNPGTASAGEYVGDDQAVVADAERALAAFDRWERFGDTLAYIEYVDARDDTAEHVALGSGISPDELKSAWAVGDLHGQRAALAALSQVGVPYKRYTAEEGVSFDCSGLTGYAWERAGIELPRSSRIQYRSATRVDRDHALIGDLMWYPGHVMLYLGIGDLVVHSPTRGRTVEYGVLSGDRASWVRFADPVNADVVQG
ncbi:MAG: C40 family peptidase [Ilumatobacteraceae bacterium]